MRQGDDQRSESTLTGEALRSLTALVTNQPRATLWMVLISACLAVGFTISLIQFKTDRSDLIDPNTQFHQRWVTYTESFGDTSDLVVVVEAEDPQLIKQVIEQLGERMSRETDHFSNVLYKVEPGKLQGKGLQYLSPEQLQTGLERVAGYTPVMNGRWDLIRVDSVFEQLEYQIRQQQTVQPRSTNITPAMESLLDHAEQLSVSLSSYLRDPNDFQNPWPEIVPIDPELRDAGRQTIYFLNDEGTMGFLKAYPVKDKENTKLHDSAASIARLKEIMEEVSAEFPEATVGVTGIPVLENDEMRRSQMDMMRASIVSVFGVGLVLFLGFRGFRHPALALIMLGVGMAWAFGYTTLAVGHLNILSVSFAAILIGLGIDFAIHYLARYLDLRRQSVGMKEALEKTSSTIGVGIVLAAITTALAFFCASLTSFLGVAELGIIAGGGVLLCALATFLVLPPLICIADQNVGPKKLPVPFQGRMLQGLTGQFPTFMFVVSLSAVLGIGALAVNHNEDGFSSKVSYDYNLLNLQAEGLDSVEIQNRIFQNNQDSLLFAVSVADTPEEARELKAKYEQLPTVHHVEELASRIPAFPTEETSLLVQGYRARLSRLPRTPPRVILRNPAPVGQAVENLYLRLRNNPHSAAVEAAAALDRFLDDFASMDMRRQLHFLNSYQTRMSAAFLGQLYGLRDASNPEPVQLSDLPPELTSRFVSSEGKWLVQVYPKDQIWDLEPLSRFVNDVRSVDEEVTGTPLQNFEASRQIMQSYETAALYALAVILLVLLIDFLEAEQKVMTLIPPLVIVIFTGVTLNIRSVEYSLVFLVLCYLAMVCMIAAILDFKNFRDALLTMFPPLAGGVLMLGLLAVFKIDLNPANLIVLPLILGIGVDDGVHVIHDFRSQEGEYRTSPSIINGITLTSLTSMIGFGSMMLAAHRGLYSVGLVLVIGVGSCLFISLVTLPAILTLVSRSDLAETEPEKPAAEKKARSKAA